MNFDDITVLNVHVNKKKENSNYGDISKILVQYVCHLYRAPSFILLMVVPTNLLSNHW